MIRRKLFALPMALTWTALAWMASSGGHALAQDAWPSKPVKIVVPFPPGGTSDVMARMLADELTKSLKQPFVIENIGGAGGTIGTVEAVRARPDGLTLLMGNIGPQAIGYSLFRNLQYRPEQLAAIAGTIADRAAKFATP